MPETSNKCPSNCDNGYHITVTLVNGSLKTQSTFCNCPLGQKQRKGLKDYKE